MTMTSIGDLATAFRLRHDNARLRAALNGASRELASGRAADLTRHLGGDFGRLAGVERGIRRAEAFAGVIGAARLEVGARQAAVGTIRSLAQDVTGALLLVEGTTDATLVDNAARVASGHLASVLGLLNAQTGGRSLFAGTAVDGPAVSDADTMLTALEAEVALAGAGTAADVQTVVQAWFAAGGGFETAGYIGGGTSLAPLAISDGETLAAAPRADDMRFRGVLAALATAALADRGILAGDPGERARLVRSAGEALLPADRDLIDLQAEIGGDEALLERAGTEVRTASDALETARMELIGVDPYEAATELSAIETQLESLYTTTARLSRLSLADYLR